MLCDARGEVIIDFNAEGIRKAFRWTKEGEHDYTEKESLALYKKTSRSSNQIKEWMLADYQELKGNPLINDKRTYFIPTAAKIITMLSRELGKKEDSKFRKEFFGFIIMISKGKRVKWRKVINDTMASHFSFMDSTKRFYMDSYLVYLLLDGKYRPLALGNEGILEKGNYPVWQFYSLWRLERRWNNFFKRNDVWDYEIYKEIKGKCRSKEYQTQ